MFIYTSFHINIKGKPGKYNDKSCVKKKERVRHLPGYCP